ncbi:MAG: Hsp20 family protein [Cyanobacteria bacterium CRU_2_1]|nr:Hsp20 family protein [Cyanobacteria bacterium RU_5_0]NJR62740.1 Hsp20 family protein [Cyanobacteria bacterium CRU_2_1]
MVSMNWQSLHTLETLHQQIQDALVELLHTSYESTVWIGSDERTWISEIKIRETDANVILCIQIPDTPVEDLAIQISPETAVIKGKPRQAEVEGFFSPGYFQNIIPLPIAVHPEAVQAQLNHNILTLTLPKSGRIRQQRITLHPTSDCFALEQVTRAETCG